MTAPLASWRGRTITQDTAGDLMRATIIAAAISIALVSLASADPVQAVTRQSINIPRQPLGTALRALARDRDFSVLIRSDLVRDKMADAVVGELTTEEAIARMLSGTGLTYQYLDDETITIVPIASTPPAPSASSTQNASFWQRLRTSQADAAAQASSDPADPSGQVEEIVVTAQKKEQSLKDVPLSVTAIGERSIEVAGISNFTDYARMTPGVSFDYAGPGGGQLGDRGVYIRGISSTNTTSGGQPVAFYIGETPVPFSDPNLFDVNRIEVLRGPQGTLYGSGSLGGTVKIVPNRPDARQFAAKADSTLSTTEGGGINHEVRGMVNIPVIEDRIAVRATLAARHDEGFIDNAGTSLQCATPDPACLDDVLDVSFRKNQNDVDQLSFRIASEIRVTDRLTLTPGVYAERKKIADRANYTVGFEHGPGGLLTNTSGPPSKEQNDFALYDLGLKYEWEPAALTSSTSYMSWKKDNVLSLSYLIQGIFGLPDTTQVGLASDVNRKLLTHESRIASTGENKLDWLVGAFYQREDFVFANYSAEPSIPLENKVLSAAKDRVVTKQYAVFTEETLHLTDKLSLIGGLRYFKTEVGSERFVKASLFQSPVDFAELLPTAKETGFTPKAEISYKASEDVLLYALAARGFRAGGTTRKPADLPACVAELAALGITPSDSFDSDSVWNYEAGAKTVWADGRLSANLSGYYIDWNDIQQELQLNCGFAFTTNFGKATSKGAELELKAAPLRGLDLGLSVGYINARLAEDSPTGVGKKGDTTLHTPQWSVALQSQYTVPVGFGFSAYVRGDYQRIGRVATTFNTVGIPDNASYRPSYEVASFATGLTRDDWDLSVFIDNAFNARPQFDSFVDSAGVQFPQAITLQPRTIGLTVRRVF